MEESSRTVDCEGESLSDFAVKPSSKPHSVLGVLSESPKSMMTLSNSGVEIMRFEENGDIFIKGELISDAKDVVQGMREFLSDLGYPTK